MHYKMRDQIRFKIGKEEKNIQEKWIEISEGTEHIQMMIEMPEEFQYMAFLFLEKFGFRSCWDMGSRTRESEKAQRIQR